MYIRIILFTIILYIIKYKYIYNTTGRRVVSAYYDGGGGLHNIMISAAFFRDTINNFPRKTYRLHIINSGVPAVGHHDV